MILDRCDMLALASGDARSVACSAEAGCRPTPYASCCKMSPTRVLVLARESTIVHVAIIKVHAYPTRPFFRTRACRFLSLLQIPLMDNFGALCN